MGILLKNPQWQIIGDKRLYYALPNPVYWIDFRYKWEIVGNGQ